jgi:uncharacterized protein (DUF58 family)
VDTDQINDLYWWAQERVQGFMSGLHRSPDFGYSVEFAQHRQYVPGDSPKHIDWSVYAKTDRFLTKLYEAESNMRTFFVLDSSSSMYYPNEDAGKWERTVQVITLIASLLQKQRDALGLFEVNDAAAQFFESSNKEENIQLLLQNVRGLYEHQIGNKIFLEQLETLHSRLPKRSQILIFTDIYHEDVAALVQSLSKFKHTNHHVRLILMYSEQFEIVGKGLSGHQVIDHETGKKTYLTEEEVRRYTNFCQEQLSILELTSRGAGISIDALNVDEDPIVLLRKLLA